jgi:hypothetical protein
LNNLTPASGGLQQDHVAGICLPEDWGGKGSMKSVLIQTSGRPKFRNFHISRFLLLRCQAKVNLILKSVDVSRFVRAGSHNKSFRKGSLMLEKNHKQSETRMILIASEQVWPNLHALLHWSAGEHGGLKKIVILHTAAEKASKFPAKRLESVLMASRNDPFFFDNLILREIATTPRDVSNCIMELIEEHPFEPWIVVANGGLKTMTLGLLQAMSRENVKVVYSEFGGFWYRQRLNKETLHVESESLEGMAATEMDRLSVVKLLKAQHLGPEDGFSLKPRPASFPELNTFLEITRNCMGEQNGVPMWDWRKGFGKPNESTGILFEQWFGGLLQALGVSNIVSGLTVFGNQEKIAANETDFMAIHGGRFFYIELKLRDNKITRVDPTRNLNEILRKSSDLACNFAGNGSIPLVLIPNWQLTSGQRELCQLFSPQPQVLDASQSEHLIPWVAQKMGIEQLPQELESLNREIQGWMKVNQLSRIFGTEAPIRYGSREYDNGLILSFPQLMQSYCLESNQNWLVWQHESVYSLRIFPEPNRPVPSGFLPVGESWQASYTCDNETELKKISKMINNSFREFSLRKVSSQKLIEAWQQMLANLKRSNPPKSVNDNSKKHESAGVRVDNHKRSWKVVLEGKNWYLERCQTKGRFRLTAVIGKKTKLNGLSKNQFPEAVAENSVEQDKGRKQFVKRILFHSGQPIDEILREFKDQLFDGKMMTQKIREHHLAHAKNPKK